MSRENRIFRAIFCAVCVAVPLIVWKVDTVATIAVRAWLA